MEDEFLSVESMHQFPLHAHALRRPLVQFRSEVLERVAPLFLGPIHRRVGVLHQRRRIVAVVRKDADADRRGDERFVSPENEGIGKRIEDLVDDQLDVGGAVDVR